MLIYLKRGGGLLIIITVLFVAVVELVPLDYNYACFTVGLSCMLFYMIGHQVKRINVRVNHFFIFLLMMVGCLCVYGSLQGIDVSIMMYNCIPVNILAATSVTYLIYLVSSGLKAHPAVGVHIAWLGRMSLVVFCIHTLMLRIIPFDRAILMVVPQISEWVLNGSITLVHIIISILFCKWVERNKILRYVFNLN